MRYFFQGWFELNRIDIEARLINYHNIPNYYIWNDKKIWQKRKRNSNVTIGRIYFVHPCDTERYYLRLLLHHIKGAQSFDDLRTVNNIVYPTFHKAAEQLGLCENDDEWFQCLHEASLIKTGYQLRQLFVAILVFNTPNDPGKLWNDFKHVFVDDLTDENNVSIEYAENIALIHIETLLKQHNQKISNFIGLPKPNYNNYSLNSLIEDELRIDKSQIENMAKQKELLNEDQNFAFNQIYDAVYNKVSKNQIFFIDGPGGTGKTFLYSTLLANIRVNSDVALAVASSGIAALLLDKGRTAHSRFKIPIIVDETSTCSINKNSDLAKLIQTSKLIIWDEAPMMNKHCFEAVDRTFRDIMNNNEVFGGKVFVFGGDFRQILPVIKHGSRADIVQSAINRSYIWSFVTTLKLTINMRVIGLRGADAKLQQDFANFLIQIGEGINNNEQDEVILPSEIVSQSKNVDDFLSTYHFDIKEKYNDSNYVIDKCLCAARMEHVDMLNEKTNEIFPGEEYCYYSCDTLINNGNAAVYPIDFLNSITPSTLPPHILKLKLNSPIILLRNIDFTNNLCNGTRLICKAFSKHVIEAEVATGLLKGQRVFIPRMSLIPTDDDSPVEFKRRQFPIRLAFAITINKSQGQTMKNIGLYLEYDVFSHGQLYVALSRVCSEMSLTIFTKNNTNVVKNVVFKEIFNNSN